MATRKYPYNQCRAFGHAWQLVNVGPAPQEYGPNIVQVDRICANCEALSTQLISKLTGAVYGRRYKYSADYSFHSQSKDKWRKDYLKEISRKEATRERHPSHGRRLRSVT